ncbi:DJ-1/PfpI family protein [Vibrio agarivorans]|uniref:DJ-1/PfpI family protein n=1 Tax=Vibrio agarivorans TaxID=153622 RepID=UPI0025B53E73|nr:DJ-1/PfpI family protein [Vibrio agarivorans]MDN3663193.1 DJ-1/PfpI family protein [Vibrio agarivorans]
MLYHIGIFIYPEAEVLDFAGPFEVFSTANRIGSLNWKIHLISEQGGLVQARGNFPVQSHYSLDDHPKLDLLIVVGGVHSKQYRNPRVAHWLKQQDQFTDRTCSVCTGVFFLANAGLLVGRKVTTHWEDQADLQCTYPDLTVTERKRFIVDGKYVTSGGISAGIDMSLALVAEMAGEELANKTAHQMEYVWGGMTLIDY